MVGNTLLACSIKSCVGLIDFWSRSIQELRILLIQRTLTSKIFTVLWTLYFDPWRYWSWSQACISDKWGKSPVGKWCSWYRQPSPIVQSHVLHEWEASAEEGNLSSFVTLSLITTFILEMGRKIGVVVWNRCEWRIRSYPCPEAGIRCHVKLLDLYLQKLPDGARNMWPAMTTRDFSWKSSFGYGSMQNLL